MSNPYLSAIRAKLIARIEASHQRYDSKRAGDEMTFHINLVAAGCWLVHHGHVDAATPVERLNGWGPEKYRTYLAALSPEALAEELETGRRVLFEGCNPVAAELAGGMAAGARVAA